MTTIHTNWYRVFSYLPPTQDIAESMLLSCPEISSYYDSQENWHCIWKNKFKMKRDHRKSGTSKIYTMGKIGRRRMANEHPNLSEICVLNDSQLKFLWNGSIVTSTIARPHWQPVPLTVGMQGRVSEYGKTKEIAWNHENTNRRLWPNRLNVTFYSDGKPVMMGRMFTHQIELEKPVHPELLNSYVNQTLDKQNMGEYSVRKPDELRLRKALSEHQTRLLDEEIRLMQICEARHEQGRLAAQLLIDHQSENKKKRKKKKNKKIRG